MSTLPGTLIHHEEVPTQIAGARAWRVTYASQDLAGRPTMPTGLVISPAAAGIDRPIMTWAHGTTALGDAGCPSAQPDPARELTVYFDAGSAQQIDFGVPGLQRLIDAGWVVAATDYQGLGSEGMHQYTVGVTNARDTVHIAVAARGLESSAGTAMVAMGWSEGGGAVASVAELDPAEYAPLTLAGVVAFSPGVPTLALSDPHGLASGLFDPARPIDPHAVMLFAGIAAADPALHLDDLLTPLGRQIVEASWNVQPVHHLGDTLNRLHRLHGAIIRTDPQNIPAWIATAQRASAGMVKPHAPILLCQDSFAGGTVVPVPMQQAYVAAVTKLGGTIEVRDYPHDDHFSLCDSAIEDALVWATERVG